MGRVEIWSWFKSFSSGLEDRTLRVLSGNIYSCYLIHPSFQACVLWTSKLHAGHWAHASERRNPGASFSCWIDSSRGLGCAQLGPSFLAFFQAVLSAYHTTTATIKWVSSESFIGLSPIQHLCSETRTISILHKQPYLELSHGCILCMHLGSYRAYFQYVYMYTLRVENIWPEKDNQSWLCCDFSKLEYFSH